MLKHLKNMEGQFAQINGLFAGPPLLITHPGQPIMGQPCCSCQYANYVIYPELERLRAGQQEILNFIRQKEEAETVYLDAEKTCDRIGISESTLLRCQRRGEIAVAKTHKGKKYFRKRDVERLRKEYRGLE